MRSSLKMLFTIGLCVSFFPVQAIFASGWTGERGIDWVNQRQCREDQAFEVRLQADHDNPDVCTNVRVLELKCDKTLEYYNQPFESQAALFNMAFKEGYLVDVSVKGCNGSGYAKVKAVRVVKP